MFTSIQKLRASSAMQDRVTSVETWLKRQNPNWKSEDKFAICAIGNSNSAADVTWVISTKSTHIAWPEMEKAVLEEFGHKTKQEHFDYLEQQIESRQKTANLVGITAKYNAAYDKVHGIAAAATPAATAATPVETARAAVADGVAKIKAETPAGETKTDTLPAVLNYTLIGAVIVALGKIVAAKAKPTVDAVRYAQSPTGSRVFGDYITEQGVDATDARRWLKENGDKIFSVVAL